jgi:fermentation-respiration switch protein FrsA (DUF1100 family)
MPLEDRFLYRPTKVGHVVGLGESTNLTTADGVKLHAIYFSRAYQYFNVLYLHGSRGALPYHRAALGWLAGIGPNLLAIDYRGYGKSEGTPSESGLYADALAGYEWLRRFGPPSSILVFGEGLGSGPACELASTQSIGALVLLSAFTNLPELAAARYPFLPTSWIVRSQFDNLAKLPKVTAPVLVAHSRNDERVPFAQGERLFEVANAPKQSLWLEGAKHREVYAAAGRPLAEGVSAFIRTLPVPG